MTLVHISGGVWGTGRTAPVVIEPPPPPPSPTCDCGITDAFNRVVASGLGTPDCGLAYLLSTSDADWSVDGAKAHSVSGSFFTVSAFFNFGKHAPTNTTSGIITAQMTSTTGTPGANGIFFGMDGVAGGFDFIELDIFADGTVTVWSDTGSTSTSVAFGATDLINIRLDTDGLNGRAKVWKASDPEPAGWTLTRAFDVYVVAFADMYFGSLTDGTAETTWENLDIDGINRCMPIQFDDFDRTVAGPFNWGVATPGGQTWTVVASANSTVFVNGSRGVIQNGSGPTGSNATVAVSAIPFGGSQPFTGTVQLRLTSDAGVLDVGFGIDNVVFEWGHEVPGSGLPQLVLTTGAGRFTTPFQVDFWDTLVGDFAIFKVQRLGGIDYIKLWDSALPEPGGWQLAVADSYSSPFYPAYVLGTLSDTGASGTQTIEILSIDFDYTGKPCYYVGGVPVFPS